jgi:hypothetical protein
MGNAIRAGGGDSRSNDQRVKTMAKKRPCTPKVGRGDEAVKRPKHADVNQHLRNLMANSQACYDHVRIRILTPPVSSEEDLSDWEEDAPVDFEFMHVSNGSEFEDLEAVPLARKAKVTLSPFPDPLAFEVVLTKEMLGTQ